MRGVRLGLRNRAGHGLDHAVVKVRLPGNGVLGLGKRVGEEFSLGVPRAIELGQGAVLVDGGGGVVGS